MTATLSLIVSVILLILTFGSMWTAINIRITELQVKIKNIEIQINEVKAERKEIIDAIEAINHKIWFKLDTIDIKLDKIHELKTDVEILKTKIK